MVSLIVPASCIAGVAECNDTGSPNDGALPYIGAVLVIVIVGLVLFRRRR